MSAWVRIGALRRLRQIRALSLQRQRMWRSGLDQRPASRTKELEGYRLLRRISAAVIAAPAFARVAAAQPNEFACLELIEHLVFLARVLHKLPRRELKKLRSGALKVHENAHVAARVLRREAARRLFLASGARDALLKEAERLERHPSLAAEPPAMPVMQFFEASSVGKQVGPRAFAIREIARFVPVATRAPYAAIAELMSLAGLPHVTPKLVRSILKDRERRT